MPEFNIVSVQEAKLRTRSGGRSKLVAEYAITIRQRLAHAAQAMEVPLVIKRAGKDIYFWRENEEVAQPRRGRGRRPRKQPIEPEPVISDLETGDAGETEDSPELG